LRNLRLDWLQLCTTSTTESNACDDNDRAHASLHACR
jgi:hypothetical protein